MALAAVGSCAVVPPAITIAIVIDSSVQPGCRCDTSICCRGCGRGR